MPVRLLLLRHAQSEWNAQGRWQGWADPPLSAAGEEAAAAASADPALDALAAVVSSDLRRASRTAELLRGNRPWGPVRTFRGLRERGAGAWTGLTRREIEQRWPDNLNQTVATIPGGEAPAAVSARGVATLHRIAAAHPESAVLVVTHGALIRLLEDHCGAVPDHVANLSGRWFTLEGAVLRIGARASVGGDAVARR